MLETRMSRDPTMFLMGFSIWAVLAGWSLLAPGSIFNEVPVYSAMRDLPISEDLWGAIMTADGAILAATCMFCNVRVLGSRFQAWLPALRASVALLTGGLWLFVGIMLLAGGAQHQIFSAGGAWDVCGGIGCLVAMLRMEGSVA